MASSTWMRRVVVASSALLATAAHANRYEIVDLGTKAYPNMVGRSGVIAGDSADSVRAMQWRRGHWHALSTSSSQAYAVNSHGDVVGYTGERYPEWPVVWSRHGEQRYLALPNPAYSGEGTAIADDGATAGWYRVQNFSIPRCFSTRADGNAFELAWSGDDCYVTGMNNIGQIIGYGGKNGRRIAFVWQDGQFQDLDTLPGDTGAYAFGINDCGDIVGQSDQDTSASAVLWRNGVLKRLGEDYDYSTVATAINHDGEIVGQGVTAEGRLTALRFDGKHAIALASEVEQLDDWELAATKSVSDKGIIVGLGRRSGDVHGFALLPLDDAASRHEQTSDQADATCRRR